MTAKLLDRREDAEKAVDEAKSLLSRYGVSCSTSLDELESYFAADTPYPDSLGLEGALNNRFFLIHELVEIDELKRRGLHITMDVIVMHITEVDDAHLRAARVELRLAEDLKDFNHIRSRLVDVRKWSGDPTVTPKNRKAYRKLAKDYSMLLSGRPR